jgi:hypothetical protein
MLFRLDEPAGADVELLLFREVRNAKVIRRRIMAEELEVAALNASLVSKFDGANILWNKSSVPSLL